KGMKRWRQAFAVWAMGAALSGICAETPEPALPRPGAIIVADVTGEVTVTYGELKKPVKVDDRLRSDALLATGRRSFLRLVLSNGAVLQLGAGSELEFEEFGQATFGGSPKFEELREEPSISRTRIRLTRGDIIVEVKTLKVARGSSFTLGLPAGLLRVD